MLLRNVRGLRHAPTALLAISALCLAQACLGVAPSVPEWVTTPARDGGTAAAACVSASGDIGIDQRRAALAARRELAETLRLRVEASSELLQSYHQQDGTSQVSAQFKDQMQQSVQQELVGTRVTRFERVGDGPAALVCASVAMPAQALRKLADDAIQASGQSDPERKAELIRLYGNGSDVRAPRSSP